MKLRMLLRELRVRPWELRGGVEPGGILESREGYRLGVEMKEGSPGMVSSVRPVRALGARANVGVWGRSFSMLGRPHAAAGYPAAGFQVAGTRHRGHVH